MRLVLLLVAAALLGSCAGPGGAPADPMDSVRGTWSIVDPVLTAVAEEAWKQGEITDAQHDQITDAIALVRQAVYTEQVGPATLLAINALADEAVARIDKAQAKGRISPSQASTMRIAVIAFRSAALLYVNGPPTPQQPPATVPPNQGG